MGLEGALGGSPAGDGGGRDGGGAEVARALPEPGGGGTPMGGEAAGHLAPTG